MPDRAGPTAPTFLLLHGIGLSHRSFTRAAKLLAEQGEVVAIDLPGFGANPRPGRPLGVEDYARGIASALDRPRASALLRAPDGRHGGPVIAVGHSMGAQFALELALQRPDLVSGLVMIGPVVDSKRRTLWQQALALARDAALEPPRTNLMVQFDYARCGVRWFLTETRAMLDYPTHERLRALAQPLLVLRGEHDPIADAEWVERAAESAGAALPGPETRVPGRAVSIPGHRHNVVHSGPRETAELILRFAAEMGSPAER